MKCARCGHDSKLKERTGGKCPKCTGAFAFEPSQGDPYTDMAFHNAIEAVSAKGQLRWGAEHLYYELARRQVEKAGCLFVFVILLLGLTVLFYVKGGWAAIVPAAAALGVVFFIRRLKSRKFVRLEQRQFDGLFTKWQKAHGQPKGLIVRAMTRGTPAPAPRALDADIADYSFDRAVICDRARTADILLANNFHFENNCAVLAIDGYPEAQFETVRAMLKRNPHLRVFALHDATPRGCQLAHTLATDPKWFAGQVPVTDVGLRPAQAKAFAGLYLPHKGKPVSLTRGLSEKEAEWLNAQALELAVIRPEQVLKRMYKALTREQDRDSGSSGGSDGETGGGGGGSSGGRAEGAAFQGGGGSGGGGGNTVLYDSTSFTYEAGDVESDSDGFG